MLPAQRASHCSREIAYSTSPSSLPEMGSSQSVWNVRTCCMPTAAIVAREPALSVIVSAKIRTSPRSSNPCRISSCAPSLAKPLRQWRRKIR